MSNILDPYHYLTEEKLDEAGAGFDQAQIDADDWKDVLQAAGAGTKPKLQTNAERGKEAGFDPHEPTKDDGYAWVWKGKGVTLYTAYDPITGKPASSSKSKSNNKNFAGYIGIDGNAAKVKELFGMIKDVGYVKGSDPRARSFI